MHTNAEVAELEALVRASPLLAPVLNRWSTIGLPDCWLVAGAVAQSVWSAAHGFPLDRGIRDVDLVYFDPADLSEDGEAAHARRVQGAFADLPATLDVKNEARVHLWYEAKFGYPVAPYASAPAAIATFPTTATAVGLQPTPSGLAVCAPFGLRDLLGLVVRPNKVQITRGIYEAKLVRWAPLWPELTIIAWEEAEGPP